MPQEVLQADWHEVWHSPHPPFAALSFGLPVVMVLIPFIFIPPFIKNSYVTSRLYETFPVKARGEGRARILPASAFSCDKNAHGEL